MTSARLQAFSDGVIAIIITIAVLGIRVPEDDSLSSIIPLIPLLLIYAWSFEVIGTYWINHHHLLRLVERVTGRMMWANLSLLFCLSLIPFATEWLGEHFGAPWPTSIYCLVLFAAAAAYSALVRAIVAHRKGDSELEDLLSEGPKRNVSIVLYVLAIGSSFIYPYLSYVFVVAVAAIWFSPDKHFLHRHAK